MAVMAIGRMRVTGPMVGRRGILRTEAGGRAVVISSLRRRLGVAAVRAQCSNLLGRLESGLTWPWVCCCQEQAVAGFWAGQAVEDGGPSHCFGSQNRQKCLSHWFWKEGVNLYEYHNMFWSELQQHYVYLIFSTIYNNMTIEDFLHFTSTMTIEDFYIQPLSTNIVHIDVQVQQNSQDNLNLFL